MYMKFFDEKWKLKASRITEIREPELQEDKRAIDNSSDKRIA